MKLMTMSHPIKLPDGKVNVEAMSTHLIASISNLRLAGSLTTQCEGNRLDQRRIRPIDCQPAGMVRTITVVLRRVCCTANFAARLGFCSRACDNHLQTLGGRRINV
jgi:hypothetical protein